MNKKIIGFVMSGLLAIGAGGVASFLMSRGPIKTEASSSQVASVDFMAKITTHDLLSDTWTYGDNASVFCGFNASGSDTNPYIKMGDYGNSAPYVRYTEAMSKSITKVTVDIPNGSFSD